MGSSGGIGTVVPFLPSDHGLSAWSMPIDVVLSASLSIETGAGIMKLARIRRVPATSVTNLHIYVRTAGSTLSNCFAALYGSAGALIGQTADQSTAWQSSGFKTMPLAGGPYALTAGDYYVGAWYNGTTAPVVLATSFGISGAQVNVNQSSGNFNAASSDTGLTTTAPPTIGAQTSSALYLWVALT